VTVLILAGSSAAVAIVIDITREFNILILIGAVLEALIYAAAGLCVIQLRRRQPESKRSFRIPFGWTIPLLSIVIFTLLGLAAAVSPTPLPLLITAIVFAISFIYVQTVVPRLKAAEEKRRQAPGRRRPPRRPETAIPTTEAKNQQ
jgi:amino acid transporter